MKRALILEDNRICSSAAKALLESLGFAVTERESASGARGAHLSEGPFDLYLADVDVPETPTSSRRGNGAQFAQWVRRRCPSAKVILWSGADHEVEARAVGVAFVLKDGQAMANLARAASLR